MNLVANLNNDLQSKIERVFRDVFDDEQLKLQADTSPETLAAWDSLGHIRLIAALEDELHQSFSLQDIEDMNSVAKILAVLESKT